MNDAVKQLFDKSVETYSQHFHAQPSGKNFVFRKRLTVAAELASPYGGRFLDCAVGTGEITLAMLQAGHFEHATLVDLSPNMLEHTRRRVNAAALPVRLHYQQADIFAHLPTSEGHDFIACLGLVAHTGRLRELLHLLRAALRVEGALLLQSSLAEHWGTRTTRLVGRWRQPQLGYAISYFTTDEILKAAAQAGFHVEKSVRYSAGLPFADKLWARANYWLEYAAERWSPLTGAEGVFVLRLKR
jgi:cyclopropane fatty-acyl-phospholipid synthase-like methyltransferase